MNSSHELHQPRLDVMGVWCRSTRGEDFQMPFSIVRLPTKADAKSQSEQELEFDRWRIAVNIIRRMREAGISCELLDVGRDSQ
jgi:hypothetical protein